MIKKFKDVYKSTVPSIIDKFNIYDKNIKNGKHKYFVPMYHRIIKDPQDDPYNLGMCVTEKTFEQQLDFFAENFTDISLSNYCQNRQDIESDNTSYITLTFDDGYRDNLDVALPIINKYKLSSTIFVCSKIFNDSSNYWWDSIINAIKASDNTHLDLSGLGINDVKSPVSIKGAHHNAVSDFLFSIWKSQRYKDNGFIKEIVSRLLGDKQEPLVGHLSEQQVIDLSNAGVDIAAHTLTHPDLTSLTLKEARYEIQKSKSVMTDLLGKDVNGFAYPAGFKSDEIVQLVKDTGFKYAVSTDSGVNYRFNPFEVERIGMPQTTLADLKRCMSMYSRYN